MIVKIVSFLIGSVFKKKRYWILSALLGSSGFAWVQDFNVKGLWMEPRDLLVDRIEDARDAQQDTAEEFKTALEKFQAVTGFSGGDLEAMYKKLDGSYGKAQKEAGGLDKKITRITKASNELLSEWKGELKLYNDDALRSKAEVQFDATRDRCEELIAAMRAAEDKTKPILSLFKDQVMFLKHNLNAKAIASLDEETATIEAEVGSLIAEMEASIAEADAFIETLVKKG